MRKAFSIVLSALLLMQLCACTDTEQSSTSQEQNQQQETYGNLSDATIWGAPGTEKILQDKQGLYDDIKTEAAIDLTVAKGELEAQHIIIAAKDKKLSYTLTLNDLSASDGTVFSKENIEVFHEKYVHVKTTYDRSKLPAGWYPDALVPYENIVQAGENVVEKEQNQGLYFRFDIPTEQPAKVYAGTAKLTIGEQSQDIPITLNVADVTVSEESHAKSIFLNQWHFHKGELDTTQEMLNEYTEALYDYRLNSDIIMMDNGHSDEDIAYYVELSYKFMQNPRCTNITIPYATTNIDGEQCIDPVIFKKYLMAYANKSFETDYNMFEKLVCYFGIIDEPDLQGILNRTAVVTREYKKALEEAASSIENDSSIRSEKKEMVAQSIRELKNVITTAYSDTYAPYVDTWCPKYTYYDTEAGRAQYDSQEERWWYGCNEPQAPYPTYHTEDTLLSARLVSWMQAEYNVTGNLFWATNIYAEYDGNKYNDIEDYYTGEASRFPEINGDGYLFYPGKKYGIEGPIGSLRLEAIRDGLEEYEILYAMKDSYATASEAISENNVNNAFTFQDMVSSLGEQMYNGTMVTADTETFQAARASLFSLATISQNTGVCIAKFNDDGYGNKLYTLVAPDNVVLKRDGVVLAPEETVGGYKKYELKISLSDEQNYFSFTAEVDGETYDFTQALGGKAMVVDATKVNLGDIAKEDVQPTVSLVDANNIDAAYSGKMLKIDLPKARAEKWQSFNFKGALLSGVGENTLKIILHVYYPGDDEVEIAFSAKYKNQPDYIDLTTKKLQKGMNTIEISMADKNWNKLGDIEYIAVYLGGKQGEPARTLYIADSVIYGK